MYCFGIWLLRCTSNSISKDVCSYHMCAHTCKKYKYYLRYAVFIYFIPIWTSFWGTFIYKESQYLLEYGIINKLKDLIEYTTYMYIIKKVNKLIIFMSISNPLKNTSLVNVVCMIQCSFTNNVFMKSVSNEIEVTASIKVVVY